MSSWNLHSQNMIPRPLELSDDSVSNMGGYPVSNMDKLSLEKKFFSEWMKQADTKIELNAPCCAATEQLLAFPELPCGTNVFVLPEIFEVALGAATRSTRKYVTTKIP